jgi:hypothetical protein
MSSRVLFILHLVVSLIQLQLSRCRYIRLLHENGFIMDAASSYASLGNILMHVYDDIGTAKQLAEIALAVQEILPADFYAARTYMTVYSHILSFFQPLRSVMRHLFHGYEIGMRSGNIFSANFAMRNYLVASFHSGTRLQYFVENLRIYQSQFHVDSILPIGQLADNLMGKSNNTIILTGDTANEEVLCASGGFMVHWIPRFKLIACMFFGEYQVGADLFMKLGGLDVLKRYTPGANFGTEYLPFGLCCYATARQVKRNKTWWTCFPTSTTTTTSIKRYQQAANETRNRVKFLVQYGCVNHLHVLHILDAEFYASYYNNKLHDQIKRSYQLGIVEAARSGFIQNAALASERYAEYLITEQKQFIEGKFQLQESMKFYHEWGAHHKVKLLADKYQSLLLLDSHYS